VSRPDTPSGRRARDLGIVVGTLPTGPLNAITDVPGVRTGHTTLVQGTDIRTGVTAVVPDRLPARCGLAVGNGYGKLVGATQVVELGEIESPILLTATLSVFRAADALLTYMLAGTNAGSVNPVVAETNDGYLSDIRARPITEAHVLAALESAAAGRPAEGAVGAGTGTMCLGFKGGIGTSSRTVPGTGTVGVLVQTNFSGTLRVNGVPIPPDRVGVPPAPPPTGNSCVLVVATDVSLDARQLSRVARRAIFTLGRVGSDYTAGSGDYAIVFCTAGPTTPAVTEPDLNPLFAATMEAAEEAVLNSLLMAETTTGHRGHSGYALPHDRLLAALGQALDAEQGTQVARRR
jgi:D-aminopeptidase